MKAPEQDLRLGQLALARGTISLPHLLEGVARVGATGESLGDCLSRLGFLSVEAVDQLRSDLEGIADENLQSILAQGETLILEDLYEQRLKHTLDLLECSGSTLERPSGTQAPELSPQRAAASERLTAEERYEFIDELGRGGMGQILRARDLLLDREIALKTLLPSSDADNAPRRLQAEARLTGRLEHPSIVPVYDLGWLSHGEPYYTMRVVRERSLASILDEVRAGEDHGYTLSQLVGIVRQVCLAIQYAHDAGVVHRDLKPENILIGGYGEVFVIDWGIAKILDDQDPNFVSLPRGALVGTPQYMAPEQAHGLNDQVDARTDVYALGAILYEVLTLKPVFEARSVLSLLISIVQDAPLPPSSRAPGRDIPRTIEEITLKALAKEPEARYPSAQTLADELNLYLDGVKERERHEEQARQLVERAGLARTHYQRVRHQLAQVIRDRDLSRRELPSWAPAREKARLWELEAEVDRLGVETEKHFGEVTRLLSQSLGHAVLDEARDALAELYWERFLQAEAVGDHATATYFESLVRQHNSGAFDQRLHGEARLHVTTVPSTATLQLWRVEEEHRRLHAHPFGSPTVGPEQFEHLPHGTYTLYVEAAGYASLEFPLLLERLADVELTVPLWPEDAVPHDFVVVSGGAYRTGAFDGVSLEQEFTDLPAFAIQRTPVTCGQYVEFLNALASQDPEHARQHAPRVRDDMPSYFPMIDGRYVVPQEDSDGDAWDPQWPICIVNRLDALAYIAWRSAQDGRAYRLPNSREWEKAARGVDGRIYPWGHHFDASFCHMRESAPGKPMPRPVGTTPTDRSPYGVLDMAGNIAEWTSTPASASEGTFVLRGGSFNSFPLMCRVDWHQTSPQGYRHVHYGFRMALDLPG
ncbi:hypothetical protein DL240_12820 [Lujinxingia litoralis]|uniref:Protein kinase domain-containing protein n=1 Tax=Lujinxingia litoralis TaxID=2211119 RepID=A0A328C9T0_9DELT|nr:bifunctional serine/threonine-protein kinase/formylglycine-generating enzyme family protein [Lujinxingia litoralis]RAL21730.1 hypothetical protein DL240_12820 [Lujinxingia litoralis]